jgi:3-phenylpropionate/cinnamic acid dioxygenase small subunit
MLTADATGSEALQRRLMQQLVLQDVLIAEAAALDGREFRRWLSFFTADLVYWIPIRSTRSASDRDKEFTQYGEPAFYDETFRELEARITKLESGWSWSEDPPSRTRRFVSNVRIVETHSEREVTVESNILLYRSRLDVDTDLWSARRRDRMRLDEGGWKIARREVYLDTTVLVASNLGVFF